MVLTRISHGWARAAIAGLCVAVGALWFVVLPAGAASLPDGRVYELVSPATLGVESNVFVPDAGSSYTSPFYEHGVTTGVPIGVAAGGEAVVYVGEPAPTGGNGSLGAGGGNDFLSRRSSGGGWTSTDLQVPGESAVYQAFSDDLSTGILVSSNPLGGEGAEQNEDFYWDATAEGGDGEQHPLYSTTPPNRGPFELGTITFGGFGRSLLFAGGNSGTEDVPAFNHLLFEANDALAPNAIDGGPEQDNLYDSVGGQPYLVNILPDGKPAPNATFGSFPTDAENYPGLNHVISAAGSRIFWTSLETVEAGGEPKLVYRPRALYVRESPTSSSARTVQIDGSVGGGGIFWTASADGTKVLFTKGALYEYDLNKDQATDLTPGVEVLGVVGASNNADYIYYVDSSYKLYLWHGGTSIFIATLSPADGGLAGGEVKPFGDGGGEGDAGDWQAAVGFHTSQVTPDGHSLLFMSNQSLTGYDNEDDAKHLDEVFLYEAGSGALRCVSCDPAGMPPVPTEFDSYKADGGLGGFFPISRKASDTPQVISADGSRVFFDSGQPLVPQDINGWLDVYEWEREGTGSCRETQGCVYLLSGGTDPEDSYLLGAGATGNDAFIISRAHLLEQDRGDDDVLYDARVEGLQPLAVPVCSGTGCQGVPPAPPIFATPSSVTFNGVGNFSPPVKSAMKSKSKPLTRAQRLARALKACRAKRSMHKRTVCEVSARHRYGSKSKARKSQRRGK
jgi:hypothetical protein